MQVHEGADVVVIGSGMGGAAFAWRLATQSPLLRIVCLERGNWVAPEDYPTNQTDWQGTSFGAWSPAPNLRIASGGNGRSADYPIDDANTPIKPLMFNGVGGSTIAWTAHFPRLKPSDFRVRSLDGVAADWPLNYDDLEPYFEINDRMIGVSGLGGDPSYPPRPDPEFPPLELGKVGECAARGFAKLGWHHWPGSSAILTAARGGRLACNHCGPCIQGCKRGAKASTDIVYWPDALERGVELRTGATVTEIERSGGRATGVVYRDADGREHRQAAAAVVVAGNGVGTPRLLLASGLGGARSNKVLGANLMFHPVGYVRGMFREALDGPVGPVGSCLYSHEFYETDMQRGFVRGFQIAITRENSLLVQAARTVPNWGTAAQKALSEEFRHSVVAMIMTEDLPELHNRIVITDKLADDGLPEVSVSYRPSENTDAMMNFGLDRAEELLRAAGAYRVDRQPYPPLTGWHLLGTAAMGNDPATSVVDVDGRCHEDPNILVCDGSVFVTAGAVNPASTIGALALRFADRLAEDMR